MRRKVHVDQVIDGDTVQLDNGKRVRLDGYDAPEKGQPGAAIFRNKLDRLVGNKDVGMEKVATDQYGRAVARLYKGNRSVNNMMGRTRIRRRK